MTVKTQALQGLSGHLSVQPPALSQVNLHYPQSLNRCGFDQASSHRSTCPFVTVATIIRPDTVHDYTCGSIPSAIWWAVATLRTVGYDAEAILAKESREILGHIGRCPHCNSDLGAPVSRPRRQAAKPQEIA